MAFLVNCILVFLALWFIFGFKWVLQFSFWFITLGIGGLFLWSWVIHS